jgi:RNA polymerase sigma-70 factor (ECF subfamily)
LGRLRRQPADPTAWDEFVKHYSRLIFGWCCRWGLQHADAEDLTQNVLLLIARKMPGFTYDPSRSFRAWLRTLTHAAWCDLLESSRSRAISSGDSQVLQLLETLEAREELSQRLEEQYDRELLAEAEARVRLRVGPRAWEAFRLLALEGLSGAEAAARLGMKPGAAFTARCRVQKMLQEQLRSLEQEDSTP